MDKERLENHHCHATNCNTKCKPEWLMCYKHWKLVPRQLQLEVWKYYRPGQCEDMKVTKDWVKAARNAINYVAELEGLPKE